jgi:hypothetical protein
LAQDLQTGNTPPQTAPLEKTHLKLRQVEPTGMGRGGMDLKAFRQSACRFRWKDQLPVGSAMRVQMSLHQADFPGLRIAQVR